MRAVLCVTVPVVFAVLSPSVGQALEKSSHAFDVEQSDPWRGGAMTCTISYYNICTGWVWVWSGYLPSDRTGVVFENDSPTNSIQTSSLYVWSAAPSGWGFTATVGVYDVDANDCPVDPPIESQVFKQRSGWNSYDWTASVGSKWAIVVTLGPGLGNPTAFVTDRPAGGATGPVSCGVCYPLDRPTHSFDWGPPGSPLCPGWTYDDGVCNAELWWICQAVGSGCGPVSTEGETWAQIKTLYR
jgi:hypothetical protein